MEMVMMPIPRPDLAQVFAVALFILAHLHLGTRKHKYPRNASVFRGLFDDPVMRAAPVVVHERPVGPA